MKSPNIGMIFARLTVVDVIKGSKSSMPKWICKCECGAVVELYSGNVRRGYTRSCGCLQRESNALRTKNKITGTPEFSTWAHIRQRCGNPNSEYFRDYGGRGIKVSPKWDTFAAFLADMGRRPSNKHSIERINNDGDYEPGNCKWATRHEQSLNKRDSRLITINGVTKNLSEWALSSGIGLKLLWQRLDKGWPADRAISEPKRKLVRRQYAPAS